MLMHGPHCAKAQCVGRLLKNRVSKEGGRALIGEWVWKHYSFIKRCVLAIKKRIKKLIAVNVNGQLRGAVVLGRGSKR